MTFLLDTHAFLWFILNDLQLSGNARNVIADPNHDILLSPASHWEIAIKTSMGKYQIPGDFGSWMEEQLRCNRFSILPIQIAHTEIVARLPFHHKDPFDRLLIAQAIGENIPIISMDAVFDNYGVLRYW
jgi:PIN domain nuclease of toxin-antitoxin system